MNSNLTSILWFRVDYARAAECAHKAIALNPFYFRAWEDLGRAYEQIGDFDHAIESFQKAIALEERWDGSLSSLAHVYALALRASLMLRLTTLRPMRLLTSRLEGAVKMWPLRYEGWLRLVDIAQTNA